MWQIRLHLKYTQTYVDIGANSIKMIWNDKLEVTFKQINNIIVSSKTLLNYRYCTIALIIHTDPFYKHFGAIISQYNNPIKLFYGLIIKANINFTDTNK